MKPNPSPKLPNPKPRSDNEGVPRKTLIDNSSEASAENRDLVHGDGGTIDLPTKPGDLSRDDLARAGTYPTRAALMSSMEGTSVR